MDSDDVCQELTDELLQLVTTLTNLRCIEFFRCVDELEFLNEFAVIPDDEDFYRAQRQSLLEYFNTALTTECVEVMLSGVGITRDKEVAITVMVTLTDLDFSFMIEWTRVSVDPDLFERHLLVGLGVDKLRRTIKTIKAEISFGTLQRAG